ncbi:hypothetical protein EXD89_05180 [Acinetobacter pittii]|nr:hypothetical protein EXD89_05180 [Acinetobacter pittii]
MQIQIGIDIVLILAFSAYLYFITGWNGKNGYEPNNPDYICVRDTLERGVPSVQVLRVPPNVG